MNSYSSDKVCQKLQKLKEIFLIMQLFSEFSMKKYVNESNT